MRNNIPQSKEEEEAETSGALLLLLVFVFNVTLQEESGSQKWFWESFL